MHILEGKPFNLRPQDDRNYRSWTPNKYSAREFASDIEFNGAIGLVITGTSTPENTIVDLTQNSIKNELEAVQMIFENEYSEETKWLVFWMGIALRNINHEEELIQWVKPAAYTLCKDITEVHMNTTHMNDTEKEMVIKLLKHDHENIESRLFSEEYRYIVILQCLDGHYSVGSKILD